MFRKPGDERERLQGLLRGDGALEVKSTGNRLDSFGTSDLGRSLVARTCSAENSRISGSRVGSTFGSRKPDFKEALKALRAVSAFPLRTSAS